MLTRWERGEDGWRCTEGPRADLPKLQEANWRACVLGLRDYIDKNGFKGVVLGLSGGIDSAVTRGDGGRCAGGGAGPHHHAALPLHGRDQPRRRGGLRQAARRRLRRAADRAGGGGLRRDAGAALRQPAGRHHRGKHPVAHARRGADGGLQQARADAAHHRQQVGGLGRLRDDLRRHERRLQSDQGPLQDRGLPPGALPQRARGRPAASGRRGR